MYLNPDNWCTSIHQPKRNILYEEFAEVFMDKQACLCLCRGIDIIVLQLAVRTDLLLNSIGNHNVCTICNAFGKCNHGQV